MAEQLIIPTTSNKQQRYDQLLPQIEAMIDGEPDLIANLSNIASVLKYGMGFFWVGFYLVKEEELVLGPFQGPVACTRIAFGKGGCGQAWKSKEIILVPDVDQFPGHIACSSESKSEIVLPVLKDGEVEMVLDVDSRKLNDFNKTDHSQLSRVVKVVEKLLIRIR